MRNIIYMTHSTVFLWLFITVCVWENCLHAQNPVCDSMRIVYENGEDFAFTHFNGNRIVVFNKPPQCHECEEMIYYFCKKIKVSTPQLLIILGPYGNMLSMQQLKHTANLILQDNYVPLYYESEAEGGEVCAQTGLKTPMVLLLSSKGIVIGKYTIDQMFSENIYEKSIKKQVQKTIRRFLK